MARKKIQREESTARLVESLAKFGISQKDIALEAGVCEKVLTRLYAVELGKGRSAANIAITKRLFEKAMSGDTACLIFWAKTRMGWREKGRPEDIQQQDAQNGRDWKQEIRDAFNSVG